MSERTRTHVMEELSRRAFDSVVPPEWVIRDQQPDYGLDIKVDLFVNSMLTPFSFYAQLKSIDDANSELEILKYQFKTERVLEYIENPLPVMLVLYDIKNKRLFYNWVGTKVDNYNIDEKRKLYTQQTITVDFSSRLDLITSDQLQKETIKKSYEKGIISESTTKYIISIVNNGNLEDFTLITNIISKWLQSSRYQNIINITLMESEDADAVISLDSTSMITNRSDLNFNYEMKNNNIENSNRFSILIKVFIIISLMFDCRSTTALNLLTKTIYEDIKDIKFIETLLCLPTFAIEFSKKNREFEALKLSEILVQNGLYKASGTIVTSLVQSTHRRDSFRQQEYRRILYIILNNITNGDDKAIFYYGLANSLRSSHYHKSAIKQYINAVRADVKYLNRSHWWAEIAGCFFLLGKVMWSEKCYRKAILLNELRIPVRALLADALFYQGKFQEASRELEKYNADTKYPICEYKLKNCIFDFFKDNYAGYNRDTDQAISTVERAIHSNNTEETLSLLEEAIQYDPLYELAWYNYSVTISQLKKADSWWFWLIAAVIQRGDLESWINAYVLMISSIREVPQKIIVLTINQVIFIFGERFFDALLENLVELQKYTQDEAEKYIAITRETYNTTKSHYVQDKEFIYRVIS